ncbi:MAG TPA: type IV pili methyl-accepting chemotaxis transducer N-terminal domain-containing protein, partial [Variovorax sp.]|nr:type IV pili methyl-accepting chemotaxis transducer N-terminal domain-containing protein [Variovorax sp.]
MSSIADKFKRLLPARDNTAALSDPNTIAMDQVDAEEGFDEKSVLMRRDAQVAAANEPVQGAAVAATPDGEAVPAAAQPATLRTDLQRQQRYLFIALAVVVLVLLVIAGAAIVRADRVAQQVGATGQSLMQSQRLAKSVSQALVGDVKAFAEVKDSSSDLHLRAHGLASGDEALNLERVSSDLEPEMGKIIPLVDRASASAKAVLGQQQI